MEFPDASTIRAICELCGHEVEFAAKKGPGQGHVRKLKVTAIGDPCRHCSTPVVRQEHSKQPKHKPGGYYYEWWLRCAKCGALYMQEPAKRFFDAATAAPSTTRSFTREDIENQDGPPPW